MWDLDWQVWLWGAFRFLLREWFVSSWGIYYTQKFEGGTSMPHLKVLRSSMRRRWFLENIPVLRWSKSCCSRNLNAMSSSISSLFLLDESSKSVSWESRCSSSSFMFSKGSFAWAWSVRSRMSCWRIQKYKSESLRNCNASIFWGSLPA